MRKPPELRGLWGFIAAAWAVGLVTALATCTSESEGETPPRPQTKAPRKTADEAAAKGQALRDDAARTRAGSGKLMKASKELLERLRGIDAEHKAAWAPTQRTA